MLRLGDDKGGTYHERGGWLGARKRNTPQRRVGEQRTQRERQPEAKKRYEKGGERRGPSQMVASGCGQVGSVTAADTGATTGLCARGQRSERKPDQQKTRTRKNDRARLGQPIGTARLLDALQHAGTQGKARPPDPSADCLPLKGGRVRGRSGRGKLGARKSTNATAPAPENTIQSRPSPGTTAMAPLAG